MECPLGWRILNEFDSLFPPRAACAGPGSRDFAGSGDRAGAIAAGGKPGTSACHFRDTGAAAPLAPPPATSAAPTPAPAAPPVPPPAENKSPADSPAAAAPPPPVAAVQTADPFGEEITLAPKKVVILKGTANWDSAFDSLMEIVQGADGPARQTEHFARGQFHDRLHRDGRHRLYLPGGAIRSIRSRRTSART